jgi:phenylacetate-coenzyme A ligase PaaK-like adenylate-forming protein
MDTRERYREVLLKYRMNSTEPGGDVCWSPELETAPRSRIREIQGEKLVAAVAFLWDYSPLYRRRLEQDKLRPATSRASTICTSCPC